MTPRRIHRILPKRSASTFSQILPKPKLTRKSRELRKRHMGGVRTKERWSVAKLDDGTGEENENGCAVKTGTTHGKLQTTNR